MALSGLRIWFELSGALSLQNIISVSKIRPVGLDLGPNEKRKKNTKMYKGPSRSIVRIPQRYLLVQATLKLHRDLVASNHWKSQVDCMWLVRPIMHNSILPFTSNRFYFFSTMHNSKISSDSTLRIIQVDTNFRYQSWISVNFFWRFLKTSTHRVGGNRKRS